MVSSYATLLNISTIDFILDFLTILFKQAVIYLIIMSLSKPIASSIIINLLTVWLSISAYQQVKTNGKSHIKGQLTDHGSIKPGNSTGCKLFQGNYYKRGENHEINWQVTTIVMVIVIVL